MVPKPTGSSAAARSVRDTWDKCASSAQSSASQPGNTLPPSPPPPPTTGTFGNGNVWRHFCFVWEGRCATSKGSCYTTYNAPDKPPIKKNYPAQHVISTKVEKPWYKVLLDFTKKPILRSQYAQFPSVMGIVP